MNNNENKTEQKEIIEKDEQGLEIPACRKGDSAVLGYSDYPLEDGVT